MQPDFNEYAGFTRRFGAFFIDSLFFSLVFFLLLFPFVSSGEVNVLFEQDNVMIDAGFSWGDQIFMLLVTVVMWVKWMGTPGKLLLDCKVVDATSGEPVGWVQALTRYIAYFISLIPLGLGFFWIIWDKRKQGFHDKIAKTVVVHEIDHFQDDESTKTIEQLLQEVR